jgi:hypothetical protein
MAEQSISQKRRQKKAEKAAEDAAGLTIAERLTRRAKEQTVSLKLSDHEGDFWITMRQPTRAEMDALQKLCLDGSLDYGFWMTGNYSMSDLIEIVQKLFESLVAQVNAAQSFRSN